MTSPYYKLPSDLAADIETYTEETARFLCGDLPAAVFKARRVPRGVYEQRRDGTFMLRVRVAGGTLSAGQASTLAALSRTYASGMLHVTTRQDVQFHDVAIENTPEIMRRLMDAGLTSKGGGGNTVRNIMACPHAGTCPAECFDVTPCAHAVTQYLIALKGSYNLPRKFKIAFSGCRADCALAQVADLGFRAGTEAGVPGFQVFAGGGMGGRSRVADILLDWIPATEIIRVSEAGRRLFDRLGDRGNKHRARLRFVLERIGIKAFRQEFETEMRSVMEDQVPSWTQIPDLVESDVQVAASDNRLCRDLTTKTESAGQSGGIRIMAQRQKGFVTVPLNLPLGFIAADDFSRIGEIAARFSRETGFRTTRSQNLLMRFVPHNDLPALAAELHKLKADVLTPVPLDRFVACAGASTCRLGICLARNAARACAAALAESNSRTATLDALNVHINGCPNSCGHQPIGAIGLFGVAQRIQGRLIPSYEVTLGGRCSELGARFGLPVGKLPAAALPDFLRDLVQDFETRREPAETFVEYFDRNGPQYFKSILRAMDCLDNDGVDRDLGAGEVFSLAGRGAGECGAGVFEVIQSDLDAAHKADHPFEILLPAARALLIVRGVDARDPDTVLREFERLFIDTGLVEERFRVLLTRGRGYRQGWRSALDGQGNEVALLLETVEALYASLNADLDFTGRKSDQLKESNENISMDFSKELDLRGVACPMNFVKAKLQMETLNVGDTLAVILDDGDPARNVPASFEHEGQKILALDDIGAGHWRVVVQKTK